MSSPNHFTSNIEDAFSEYVLVVPDYSPASPDKTYSSTSNNSTDELLSCKSEKLQRHLSLQVKQKKDRIFISQDKYVAEILRKFRLSEGKSASTLIDAEKPLLKDSDGKDVDVHTYRSMIGSLMYLASSRPDIMFAVCACA
nr:hypothetical protein [Tanacetum cinerariifolium]